jgi:hypothetical protein
MTEKSRETFQQRNKRRSAASKKGWRTRARMKIARERERQRRDDEYVAEHGLVRPLRP